MDTVCVQNSSVTHISGSGNALRCGSIGLLRIDKTDPVKMLELQDLRAEWQREMESDTDLRDVTWRMQLSRYNISRDPAESGQIKRIMIIRYPVYIRSVISTPSPIRSMS